MTDSFKKTPQAPLPTASVFRGGVFGNPDPKLVWRKYCSFLNLTPQDFRDIQEQLLLEQINLVQDSPLGRYLLKGATPKSVEEFRSSVPLTSYGDYLPYLASGSDNVLGNQPLVWAHTTGAQADFKFVPYTPRGLERLMDNLMAAFILAAATREGDVKIWPGAIALHNTAERPYLSGLASFGMAERFGLRGVLDPITSEGLDFKERVRQGFKQALGQRVDIIVCMTSVLVKVGESFASQARQTTFDRSLLRPLALFRVGKAFIKSKLLRRQVLPKDLWPTKAIVGWGIDTNVFRDKVRYYWGKSPYEIYACTEGGIMAMQSYQKQGLVFSPYADFFEFIPMEESQRSREDTRYVPKTVLLDEVQPGQTYELVITSFYGMAFIRYRVGHFIESLPGNGAGSSLPQFAFVGRADDRIDLAGFTRIDEKTIWEALSLSGLKYEDWAVRKEFEGEVPIMHLYIEFKDGHITEGVDEALHMALKDVDPFYRDLETMLGIRPLRVTTLPPGAFDRFYDFRKDAGLELGKLRPPHMNATQEDIVDLLRIGG